MKRFFHSFWIPFFAITAFAQDCVRNDGGSRGFAAAMDLYQARKYAEAKAKFTEVREGFKSDANQENNPATLAAFYETECLRKLGDLDGLAAAVQKFDRKPLTRAYQLRQLELDGLWELVRKKDWARLDVLVRERSEIPLPGDQRAQLAWCHGLALEGLNRPEEALSAYQTAMIADAGTSEEITRQAALRILGIHQADPAVREAMKNRGSPGEDKNSRSYANLKEAAAVASLFQLSLGGGTPLPEEFREFLEFKPES